MRLPTQADVLRAARLLQQRTNRTTLFPPDVAAAAAAAAPTAAAPAEFNLPPTTELVHWLSALVKRDGPDVVACALLGAVKGEQLNRMMKILCDTRWPCATSCQVLHVPQVGCY